MAKPASLLPQGVTKMTSNLIALGKLLDEWEDSGRIGIVESEGSITIGKLSSDDATEIGTHVASLAWEIEISDEAGEAHSTSELEDDLGPYRATIHKKSDGPGIRLLTKKGFGDFLANDKIEGICELSFATVAFASGLASFCPIGTADLFSPANQTKSPKELVRSASNENFVPRDIRGVILRNEVSEVLWSDCAFQVFAKFSAPRLVCALASEVFGNNEVAFLGPPRAAWSLDLNNLTGDLTALGFENLQSAASWIYEDISTSEQRHAMYASEFAMSANRLDLIGHAFSTMGRDILNGARLAFQLSQSELIRETIKTQGELRKSIVDDTTKAAETCRSLVGATAVAIATGISLVAARAASTAEPWVLSAVAFIVAIYLFVVTLSGWAQLNVQRSLREQWRKRLYRFIPDDDYNEMVLKPTKAAEGPYHLIGAASLLVCALLAGAAIAGLKDWSQLRETSAGSAISATQQVNTIDKAPKLEAAKPISSEADKDKAKKE
jgi:hypothetical protein